MKYWVGLVFLITFSCGRKSEVINKNDPSVISAWITDGDQSNLLKKQILQTNDEPNNVPTIVIDTSSRYQTVDGFGFTLTGGSAQLINNLGQQIKLNLLRELFSTDENGISISYLRLSIGASDLDDHVFSYDDVDRGLTDVDLDHFSIKPDYHYLIPILKEILKINPDIKIMATPWSAPVWMKSNLNSIGGSLLPKFYNTYAHYLVKYIQAMDLEGIKIDAITIQNEPQHGGNNPSMLMSAEEQNFFIKNNLALLFIERKIKTKIIIWDHNADNPDYPISILNDADARKYIDGTAFHLYNGSITALSKVKEVHPDKNLYFTEQWTGAKGSFSGDFVWHTKNIIIGSMQNWSKTALEWNLANDNDFGPHTPGGCTECKGALTIDGEQITRNVSYYIIAQISKFVPSGSVRIKSNAVADLPCVAFLTPQDRRVLIVLNETNEIKKFNIQIGKMKSTAVLNKSSAGTFVW
ncbi:MAG: glycoside hydrolase family 30 beta sandwich domain-containing protein [Saprospiraceae bacterium]